jgi:uncharacterized repeat protein (TIGR03803 family)
MNRAILTLTMAAAIAAGAARASTLTVLHSFDRNQDLASGIWPRTPALDTATGKLIVPLDTGGKDQCTTLGCGTIVSFDPAAPKRKALKLLHAFDADRGEGQDPTTPLLGDGGTIYGTTSTIAFSLVPAQRGFHLKALHIFGEGQDLQSPGALMSDPVSGVLYGTTCSGGDENAGTFYSLTPDADHKVWTYALLFSFDGAAGGQCPQGKLVMDGSGIFYGTASGDGDSRCLSNSCGLVYELRLKNGHWRQQVLHVFTGQGGDGRYPAGGLISDAKGNLYGVTLGGGSDNDFCSFGCGTVYELVKHGWTMSVLHQFQFADGAEPQGRLVFDAGGNLYGTTPRGGPTDPGSFNKGTVFELAKQGQGFAFSTLHFFCSQDNCADGRNPIGGVVVDGSGTVFGTTFQGGTVDDGTIFQLTP